MTWTPTLLPYPDALDLVVVHDAVMAHVNGARADQGAKSLLWDETLQELAEGRAREIVKGSVPLGEFDDSLAIQLGEPVAELRACMEDTITTPDTVAEVAVEHWLGEPDLSKVLLGNWKRIGVGFDWGCPDPQGRGVVLVVLLAGGSGLREG